MSVSVEGRKETIVYLHVTAMMNMVVAGFSLLTSGVSCSPEGPGRVSMTLLRSSKPCDEGVSLKGVNMQT